MKTTFNPAEGSPATADQMAAIMLLHGTDKQKKLAELHAVGIRPHGCYDRKPLGKTIWVQDGYQTVMSRDDGSVLRAPVYKQVTTEWNDDGRCQYTKSKKTNGDPSCHGCIWKATNPDME